MELSELKIGSRYQLKRVDREYPVLERDPSDDMCCIDTGKTEVVAGDTLDVTVLAFPSDRPDFARVLNHRSGREHLVHVPTIETAAPAA